MSLTPIAYDSWERKEHLEHFGHASIYLTVQIDITQLYRTLKQRGLRLYPALIYCVAKVINQYPEFRYAYDAQKRIGQWDLHPYYTVPRTDNPALFSMKYTRFTSHFPTFYEAFQRDYALAAVCGRLLCDEALPENICGVSCVPGTHFSAFNFGGDPKGDFTPFILFGRWDRQGERILLPVGGEFSHAVNDGFHISRFFAQLEDTAAQLCAPQSAANSL